MRSASNCAAMNRILDASWPSCLRVNRNARRARDAGRRPPPRMSRPFFVPPKETTSTPASVVISPSAGAERDGGVGQAGAVDVQVHAELVRRVADRPGLLERVDGAELGGLGDRDDAGLDGVLVTAMGLPAADVIGGELALAVGDLRSLVPARRSGAPHSSTFMWATSVQMTASCGSVSASMEVTFAPVPLKTKNACRGLAEVLADAVSRGRRVVVVAVGDTWPSLAAAIAARTSGWTPELLSDAKPRGDRSRRVSPLDLVGSAGFGP